MYCVELFVHTKKFLPCPVNPAISFMSCLFVSAPVVELSVGGQRPWGDICHTGTGWQTTDIDCHTSDQGWHVWHGAFEHKTENYGHHSTE